MLRTSVAPATPSGDGGHCPLPCGRRRGGNAPLTSPWSPLPGGPSYPASLPGPASSSGGAGLSAGLAIAKLVRGCSPPSSSATGRTVSSSPSPAGSTRGPRAKASPWRPARTRTSPSTPTRSRTSARPWTSDDRCGGHVGSARPRVGLPAPTAPAASPHPPVPAGSGNSASSTSSAGSARSRPSFRGHRRCTLRGTPVRRVPLAVRSGQAVVLRGGTSARECCAPRGVGDPCAPHGAWSPAIPPYVRGDVLGTLRGQLDTRASAVGGPSPDTTAVLRLSSARLHRRQLHRREPTRGGDRRPYGGTRSLGLKRGALVLHPRFGLAYVGGTMDSRISLHDLVTGTHLTQRARPADCTIPAHNA